MKGEVGVVGPGRIVKGEVGVVGRGRIGGG